MSVLHLVWDVLAEAKARGLLVGAFLYVLLKAFSPNRRSKFYITQHDRIATKVGESDSKKVPEYDFIIVGGGKCLSIPSSGCLISGRNVGMRSRRSSDRTTRRQRPASGSWNQVGVLLSFGNPTNGYQAVSHFLSAAAPQPTACCTITRTLSIISGPRRRSLRREG